MGTFERILTVITPSYNRAEHLLKCWESLKKQTCEEYEWIIVDDGSTDNTKQVVNKLLSESSDIRIKYVYKENGGKHTAMNAAHPYIGGKYTLILDSDDYLTENAVERTLEICDEVFSDPMLGTVILLRGNNERHPLAYGEKDRVAGDYRELKRISTKNSSDCCEVFRSDLFIAYPYTEYKDERFLSESELWNRLAEDGYKCMYVNEVVYICNYLSDGLTASGRKMRIKNPKGGMCTSEYFLNSIYSLKTRVKKGLLYVCYGFFAEMSPIQIITMNKKYIGMKTLCLLPGYVMYRIWQRQYGND